MKLYITPIKWSYNLSYQFIRPFIRVITPGPFITSRGQPCSVGFAFWGLLFPDSTRENHHFVHQLLRDENTVCSFTFSKHRGKQIQNYGSVPKLRCIKQNILELCWDKLLAFSVVKPTCKCFDCQISETSTVILNQLVPPWHIISPNIAGT